MASDLLRAVVRRSVRAATGYAVRYTSANRTYQVRVTRPAAQPTFSRSTATWSNPADEEIYVGPAHVFSVGSGGQLSVGDEPTYYSATRVSLDRYTGKQPRRDDLVLIVDDETSRGTGVAGRTFRVDDVELGGLIDTGVVLSVSGAAPSRQQR